MALYRGYTDEALQRASASGGTASPTADDGRHHGHGPRRVERRRLVILYADVAGYTRLLCEDEESTQQLLDRYLDVLGAHVLASGGTICHYAGDAILACFGDARPAVTCALEAQREFARRNRRSHRLQFRIGINAADVIMARGEIFGVGVNIAARLQALAAPGGVCLSAEVRDALLDTADEELVDLGACWLKDIDAPVRAWRFVMDRKPGAPGSRSPRRAALAAALHDFASAPAVRLSRERAGQRRDGVRINALRNLSLVDDGDGGASIRADIGRRGIGVVPAAGVARRGVRLAVAAPRVVGEQPCPADAATGDRE